jgi:hypothetical protein
VIYKATLKTQLHPKAYTSDEDNCRCGKCGELPEPCEDCRKYGQIIAEMNAVRAAEKAALKAARAKAKAFLAAGCATCGAKHGEAHPRTGEPSRLRWSGDKSVEVNMWKCQLCDDVLAKGKVK